MAINTMTEANRPHDAGQSAIDATHDLNCQRLRILRCTAHAMASSPGGLRFRAGTRPWLDDLPACQPIAGNRKHLRPNGGSRPAAT